jgi:hypothetical protein
MPVEVDVDSDVIELVADERPVDVESTARRPSCRSSSGRWTAS